MNFGGAKQREGARVEITPLIDIVFLLLIFFMITTTFEDKSGIDVTPPEAKSGDLDRQNLDLMVAVGDDGAIALDGERMDLDALTEAFAKRSELKGQDKPMVIIEADQDTQHGLVVKIMDRARSTGLTKIGIATRRPLTPPKN